MNSNLLISIGRQYGSGGREIGEKLAAKLGIAFYNNELITLAAQKSGMAHNIVGEADEKATNSLLYTLAMGSSFFIPKIIAYARCRIRAYRDEKRRNIALYDIFTVTSVSITASYSSPPRDSNSAYSFGQER